jgi:uncharacterized damage-inducible protein DinB
MNELINANIAVLEQLTAFVTSCRDDAYSEPLASSPSSIGKHIRHILDHYQCLEHGFSTQLINYNSRTRDSQLERHKALALESAQYYTQWLQALTLPNHAIKILSDTQLGKPTETTLDSTPERELLYLINHSVHHLAYAALLAKLHGLNVPNSIGLAPSTYNYQQSMQGDYCEIS